MKEKNKFNYVLKKVVIKRAFTLIEMLIVIAVIGILAAIIIVSVSGTRGKANAVRAKGDFAQIKNAIEKSYSVNGCSTFNFSNPGGNKATLSCGTDSVDIQLPPAGTYTLTVGTCTETGTTSWATSGTCPTTVAAFTGTYTLRATNAGGTFDYSCTQTGCSCATASCDSF